MPSKRLRTVDSLTILCTGMLSPIVFQKRVEKHLKLVYSLNIRRTPPAASSSRALDYDLLLALGHTPTASAATARSASARPQPLFATHPRPHAEAPPPLRSAALRCTSDDALMHPTSVLRHQAITQCCYATFERAIGDGTVWLLRHTSPAKRLWQHSVFVLFAYILFFCPCYVAFEAPDERGLIYSSDRAERAVETILTCLCAIDIVMQAISTYETRSGRHVVSLRSSLHHYLTSTFAFDLLACLPATLLVGPLSHERRFCSILTKLFKLPRGYSVTVSLHTSLIGRSSPLLRKFASSSALLLTLAAVFLITHWLSCAWLAFARTEALTHPSDNWELHVSRLAGYSPSLTSRWSAAWVAVNFMLVGAVHEQVTLGEQLFTSVVMILGACLSGILVSKLSVYLSELNAEKAVYATKIAHVRAAMKRRNLPAELQRRCLQYYDYVWSHYAAFDVRQRPLADVSPALSHEINVFTHRAMVQQVPFFRNVPAAVVHDIMERLQPEIYLGEDFIVHMGEPGRALYFIEKGLCSVLIEKIAGQHHTSMSRRRRSSDLSFVSTRHQTSAKEESHRHPSERTKSPDSSFMSSTSWLEEGARELRRVKVLTHGCYFGEMSIIDEEATASAHVVAETVVEVQALLKNDFLELMQEHPSLEIAINRAIGKSLYYELDERGDDLVERRAQLQQLIVDVPLFACCSVRAIKDVVSRLRVETFEKGEVILEKGEAGKGLFILTDGQCDVIVPDLKQSHANSLSPTSRERWEGGADGTKTLYGMPGMELLRTLHPGEWFGELSLLKSDVVTAFVIAKSDCEVGLLPKSLWEELRELHPELSMNFKAAIEDMNYKALSPFASDVPFFRGMPREMTQAVMSRLEQRTFQKGQYVQRAHASGAGLFFISSGTCSVNVKSVDDTDWKTVRELTEGSAFGEASLLIPGRGSGYSVVVSSAVCVLHFLTQRSYREVLALHPQFRECLVQIAENSEKMIATLSFAVTEVPLFKHCSPQVVGKIVNKLRIEHYEPGAFVIMQGQPGRALYVIRKGACEVTVQPPGEELRVVGRVAEGGQFGELALLYPDRPTAAHVVCVTKLEALVLLRSDFEELRVGVPEFQEALAKRVQEMKYEEQNFLNGSHKELSAALGAALVLELAQAMQPRDVEEGAELQAIGLAFIRSGSCCMMHSEEDTDDNFLELGKGCVFGVHQLMRLSAGDDRDSQDPKAVVVATSRTQLYVVTEERLAKMHKSGSLLFNELKKALPEYFALTCKAATPPINESVRRPSILINKRRSSNAASTMAFDSTIGPNADMATLRMQMETKLDVILTHFSRLDRIESAIEKLTSAVEPLTSRLYSPSAQERRRHGASPTVGSKSRLLRAGSLKAAPSSGRQPSAKFRGGLASALEGSVEMVGMSPAAATRLNSESAASEEVRRLRQRANE
ncbi:hypothetical protein AB1Y20_013981 [Prymnesium parvum]|uniref:Cyclic nucleotide-binding domain-containing protein n=1 Tax=Prymnesium parvum TaxID=97485 RepID=A0AB34IER1_PRYPA